MTELACSVACFEVWAISEAVVVVSLMAAACWALMAARRATLARISPAPRWVVTEVCESSERNSCRLCEAW